MRQDQKNAAQLETPLVVVVCLHIIHCVIVACLHITPCVLVACLHAPVLIQHPQPHPLSSGIGNCYKWRPWALEWRGEWHSQSYLLLLPPHSRALLPRMGRVHCFIFWLLYLSPTSGIHVHRQTWYTRMMPIIVNELIAPVISTFPCVQFATENVTQQQKLGLPRVTHYWKLINFRIRF